MATYAYTFTSGDVVTPTKLNDARTVSEIVDADIDAAAGIVGTKIAPDFGSQNAVANSFTANAQGSAGVRLANPDTTSGSFSTLAFRSAGDGTARDRALINGGHESANNSGYMSFETRLSGTTAERMRITAAGNVGIATTSPSATLHVLRGTATGGTAQFNGTQQTSHFAYSTDENTYIRGGKTASNVYVADMNTGDVILATGGGNVGINTSSPTVKLDVNGIVNTNATYRVNGQIVVGARRTGWTAPTGTATRATFDSGTVTLSQLAARVHALIDDLAAHGLIDS